MNEGEVDRKGLKEVLNGDGVLLGSVEGEWDYLSALYVKGEKRNIHQKRTRRNRIDR